MSNVSCSIVLFKSDKKMVENLIKSLTKANIKIFLIDNSPVDELKCLLDISPLIITYIFNPSNPGFGAGHNIALKLALQQNFVYHIVINPDISLDHNSINEIKIYMDNNLDIGLLMPKILNSDGSIQYLCKLIPTPFDLMLRRFLPKSIFKKSRTRFQMIDTNYNSIMEVPYLSGCFMFLRLNVLKYVGYFDERFFMYPEDIDLSRRIHEVSKTIFYPNVSIFHLHEKASYKSFKMFYIHFINLVRYFNKWGWFFDKKRDHINSRISKINNL